MVAARAGGGSPTAAPSLADDLVAVKKILLRVASPADLVRAALASKRWLEVASSPDFLRRHRARHASLPLLGLYVPRVVAGGAPSFQVAGSVRSDRALARFVHRGDFSLIGLAGGLDWRLLDCRGGCLLLAAGECRVVYDPVPGRRVADFLHPQDEDFTDTIAECLLQGHGDDPGSFRVVSVEHCRRDRMIRAVEYSSRTRKWQFHRWADNIKRPQHDQAMHAGRLIFWRYQESMALMLDTTTMDFSTKSLPCAFFPSRKYAIGDTGDGRCCLVGLVGGMYDLQLHLWLLHKNGDAKSREPDKKVPMIRELLDRARLRQVHEVSNGIAILCWDQCAQYAVDLKEMCLCDKFECSALGYPLHMPWPPAVLVKAEEQNHFAIEETEMNAYTTSAAGPPSFAIEAPELYGLKEIKAEKNARGDAKGEVTIPVCEPGLQILEPAASIATTVGSKSVEVSQRQTIDDNHELSLQNMEFVPPFPVITTPKLNMDTLVDHVDRASERVDASACSEVLLDLISGLEDPSDTKKAMAVEVENLVETVDMERALAKKEQDIMATEETEMNKMVGIHENQMAHGCEIVSMSKLDHGDERIHCNQMVIQGSEMVQGIEMAPNNNIAEVAPPTSSRCSSDIGNGAKMNHFNQMGIHGSEVVEFIEMTCVIDTVKAPPTTSTDDSKIVRGIEVTIVNDTVEAPSTTSTDDSETVPISKTDHGCEMIQDTEKTRDNDTADGARAMTSRRRRQRSSVWEHFTAKADSDGCIRASCNHCKQTFVYSSGSKCAGTSHLKRHITLGSCPVMKCKATPTPSATGTENGGADTAEKPSKRHCAYAGYENDAFNQERSLSFLAKMIILHDYPLHIVQQPTFISFVTGLQPSFKVVDTDTMEAEVYAVYQRERDNLLKEFGAIPGKISLTAGSWTTSQSLGFISLAGQFIDSEWKLHRRMLSFMMVPQPCKENAVSEAISKSLPQWSMKDKMFTITVDNDFSSHDIYSANLRDHLAKKNIQMAGGDFSVMRCYAHILNETAHDVIASVQSAIYRIRENIKFIRSCVSHEHKFLTMARQMQIRSTKTLCLDITTQWNTTYLMLLAALDYRQALTTLETCDSKYNEAPSAEDWKKVEVACKYLKLLYDSAHNIMATADPTANIFFHEAWRFQQEISTATALQDPTSWSITKDMHERFDKYWKDCNVVLAIAVVMDPRFKMKIVEFSYSKIYGVKAAEYVKRVDDAVHELYKEYDTEPFPLTTDYAELGRTDVVPSKENKIPANSPTTDLDFEIYLSEITLSKCSKSELDCYLEEGLAPRIQEFDILKWWKLNSLKYPTLSRMARDVLAMPMSMVGSRSSIFSAGREVRMLDDYRSSLRPEIVEALFCAKDWLQNAPLVLY